MFSLVRISHWLVVSLFILAILGIIPDCYAETSSLFDQAAADERSGNYAQAEQAYQSILANVPGSEDAFRAQKYLAMLYIASKQDSKAQQAITQLTANFASRSDLPAALHGLSVWYGATGNLDNSKQLCQTIIQNDPSGSFAPIAKLDAAKADVILSIKAGSFAGAQSQLDKISQDFAQQPGLPAVFYEAVEWCERSGNPVQTKALCQKLIQRYPGSQQAQMAALDAAGIDITAQIESGNYASAKSAADAVIATYSGRPGFVSTLTRIADAFNGHGQFEQSCSIYDALLGSSLASVNTGQIDQAAALIKSGNYTAQQYASARDTYQRVLKGLLDGECFSTVSYSRLKAGLLGSIQSKEFEKTGSFLTQLEAGYSDRADFPVMLYAAAIAYEGQESYHNQAGVLYDRIIQQCPATEDAELAKFGKSRIAAMSAIKSGDYAAAESAVNAIDTKYQSHPVLPCLLYAVASGYASKDDNNKADALFDRIIQQYPATEQADLARFGKSRNAVLSAIKSGDYAAAESAMNADVKLQSHPEMPCLLYAVANGYESKAEQDKANVLYDRIIQQYPATEQADLAKFGQSRITVMSAVKAGDYAAAESAINAIDAKFQSHLVLPCLLYAVASGYASKDDNNKADALYDRIIQQYPATEQADLARFGKSRNAVLSALKSGDYAAAESAIGAFDAKFQNHPEMPCLLHAVASGYESKADNSKAKALYDRIIQQFPAAEEADLAKFGQSRIAIISLVQSGDYEMAEAQINIIDAKFKNHPVLACLLHNLAIHYEIAGNFAEAKRLYGRIHQEYPNSSLAALCPFYSSRADTLAWMRTDDFDSLQSSIENLKSNFETCSELPAFLREVSIWYEAKSRFGDAVSIYQWINQHFPQSDQSKIASMDILRVDILTCLRNGDYTASQEILNKLKQDFCDNPNLGIILYNLACWYEGYGKFDEAQKLHDSAVRQSAKAATPDAVQFDVSRITLLRSIKNGNSGAKDAISGFISTFSGYPGFTDVLYSVAVHSENCNQNETAKAVYNHIVQRYPNTSYAGLARLNLAKINALTLIDSGYYAGADAAVTKLKSDFANHEFLSQALFRIAEQYSRKGVLSDAAESKEPAGGYIQKSISICEDIVATTQIHPDLLPGLYYFLGDQYGSLGQLEKSAECYQYVVDNCPNYPRVWSALFLIARNYENLRESGTKSDGEADSKIKIAYEQIAQKYPDSPAAKEAQRWLSSR